MTTTHEASRPGTTPAGAGRPTLEAPRVVGHVRAPSSGRRPGRPSVRYRRMPGLDGLRALAVAVVVAFHLAPATFPGGYVGVDVFFVLSGFLITTLLVREHRDRHRVGLRSFWVRRARRLLPALGLVVAVCTAAAAVVGGDVLVGIGSQLLGAATFTSNWVDVASGATYSGALLPHLFGNLWSLAVEEQFYLLWPLVVVLLCVARPLRRRAPWVVAGLGLASAALMVLLYAPGADPTRVYVGTDTHLFALMAGAALAFWHVRPVQRPDGDAGSGADAHALLPGGPRVRTPGGRLAVLVAGVVGAVVLGVAVATMRWDDALAYRGGLLVCAVAATAVLNAVVCLPGVGTQLDRGPLGWVGRRSYGLYLWHWPVLVLAAASLGTVVGPVPPGTVHPVVVVVTLAVTVVAATLSFRYVERPVLRRGLRGSAHDLARRLQPTPDGAGPRVLTRRGWALAASCALVVGLSAAGVVNAPATTSVAQQIAAGEQAARATQAASDAPAEAAPEAGAPEQAAPQDGAGSDPAASSAPSPEPDEAPDPPAAVPTGDQVTVVGDSVTLASAPALLSALPGAYVDGAVSRQVKDGPAALAAARDAGALRPYVVVSLGTNSTASAAAMDELLAAIGPDHRVVLVTGYADRPWVPGTNAEIVAAAGRHPGVVVADWSAAVAADPSVLGPDGVHPTDAGTRTYTAVVVDGLTRAAASGSATR
ncbi:acyltransferase [Cellulosimicrobium cellulans]|uniref:acyltransferase family protein n=1 Tax=Cellulosimicrobium cellulans TaxID=1710 RepID=UPI001965FF30|nr:acyltransferase family protein [Cellulosimicrobium cellulans]MBN0041313.1 acyltransferase [Cellulosimicrobium cellulans]